MNECHSLAINILKNLYIDTEPFLNNDDVKIKKELKKITRQIDNIFDQRYITIDYIKQNIQTISNKISEFTAILNLYLFNPLCKQRGQIFSSVLQEYLCKNNGQKLDMLYHLLANLGIILSGCIYIYIQDNTKSGKTPDFIPINKFLSNLTNPKYRFSKTLVKNCIQTTYKENGNQSLNMARLLLIQSKQLRQSIVKYCPNFISQQCKSDKDKHIYFEQRLDDIISELNKVISKF